jgi:hypothetical protein
MNSAAIQKCLTELGKPEPRFDYVIGILETLLESLPGVLAEKTTGTTTPSRFDLTPNVLNQSIPALTGEGKALDALASAKLHEIQLMGGTNTPTHE